MSRKDHKRRFTPNEAHDVFTGEVFIAKSHNHYEENDGLPAAPEIELPRLSTRERVELLTRGGFSLHDVYRQQQADQADEDELDILDAEDENEPPPTRDEFVYLNQIAERDREAAEALAAADAPPEPPVAGNAPAPSPSPGSPSSVPVEPARPGDISPTAPQRPG